MTNKIMMMTSCWRHCWRFKLDLIVDDYGTSLPGLRNTNESARVYIELVIWKTKNYLGAAGVLCAKAKVGGEVVGIKMDAKAVYVSISGDDILSQLSDFS